MPTPVRTISITNSAKSTFLDCPYRYYLEYVRRLTPREEADYFRWGRLVHEVREQIDKEGPAHLDDCIAYVIEGIREDIETGKYICTPQVCEEFEYMFDALPGVFAGWLLKFRDKLFDYESYGAEKKFELVLWEGTLNGELVRVVFKGKIDNICREKKVGIDLNWEIKTAAQTGESYYFKKQLDGQPKGYLLATQRAIGFNVNRVMYEVFKKPQKISRESKERYFIRYSKWARVEYKKAFERRVIVFTQKEIDEYEGQLLQTAEMIVHNLREGLWPMHHPGNRMGNCAFQTICLHGEQTNAEIDNFYTREAKKLHPEL